MLPKTDILFDKFINLSLLNNEMTDFKIAEINNQNDMSDVDSDNIATNDTNHVELN